MTIGWATGDDRMPIRTMSEESNHPRCDPPMQPGEVATGPTQQEKCDAEFSRYEKERDALTKAEIDTEKGYDTLLVSLATLAIGASFVIVKDILRSSGTSVWLVLAWITFGASMFIALADKLLSYWTHKDWREVLDAEFRKQPWEEGTFERAEAEYVQRRLPRVLPWFKWVAFGMLLLGVIFLMSFVFVGTAAPAKEDKPQQPPVVIVNQYNGPPTTTTPDASAPPTTTSTTSPSPATAPVSWNRATTAPARP